MDDKGMNWHGVVTGWKMIQKFHLASVEGGKCSTGTGGKRENTCMFFL